MGLPLFVAPVESDLPSKAADKSGATSPSRSGIRRNARPDSRERRAVFRRHMSIRERLTPGNSSLRRSSSSGRDGREDPTVRIAEPPHLDEHRGPRPFREVLRDMARTDDRSRERFDEQLHHIFNGNGRPEEAAGHNVDLGLGWWAGDPIPPRADARMSPIAPLGSRQDGPESHRESHLRSRARISPLVQQPTLPRPSSETDGMSRRRRADPRNRPAMSGLDSQRNAIIQRIRGGLDGLGDRDRSLSPEVWDTLLTTLTPDPQPPSAGSSFASTVASQSAGVSSSTSMTGPTTLSTAQLDQACESGCEGSDTDEADFEQLDRERLRNPWTHLPRARIRVEEYNLDGPADGPVDRPADGPFSRGARHRNAEGVARATAGRAVDPATRRPITFSDLRSARPAWVGQLSVGASDNEQEPGRRSQNRSGQSRASSNRSAASRSNMSPGDEEWESMQRIVRSLARREDIPDEWWAEAGLSRTLPPDGTH